MKNCLLALLLLFSTKVGFGQKITNTSIPLQWKTVTDWSTWQEQLHEKHYCVVIPKPEKSIQEKISVLQLISADVWVVKIHQSVLPSQLGIEKMSWLTSKHKLHPALLQQEGLQTVWIQVYEVKDKASLPIQSMSAKQKLPKTVVQAQLSLKQIQQVADLPFVAYIQAAPKLFPLIGENLIFHHAPYAKHSSSWGLNGTGVIVGIGDGGTVRSHYDLNDRLLNSDTIDINSHGSTVAGIIAGTGKLDAKAEGFAPATELIVDYYSNMIVEAGDYYGNFDMSIANHSYATGWEGNFCDAAGDYDMVSEIMDEVVNDYPNVLHCIAAGNSGTSTCLSYPNGFGTVLNSIQSAKNVLTVGALQGLNQIWSSSSRGPVSDGRIKPEIVAMGTNVRTTNTLNAYGNNNGTSFATPSVAGAAALLTELYQRQFPGMIPDATLLKGVLCNGATDLGNKGPDFIYGFGSLDVTKSAKIIDNQRYVTDSLSEGETRTFSISVPNDVEQLKVMLIWNDPAAAPAAAQALINDLDLEITAPDISIYYPWLLDTTATQVNQPAFRGSATQRDRLNNIEQVTVETPISGIYEIIVSGHDIAIGKQAFHIIYDWASPMLELRHPLGGETFVPGENLRIRWADSLGITSDILELFYSENAGGTWIAIDQNISGTATQYQFTIPNIASDEVQIRIQNISGTMADTTAHFTIMGRPVLTAETLCGGDINLSWTAADNAAQYEVFELINEEWQLLQTTTQLSYDLLDLVNGSYHCYSVQAVHSSGIRGLRSVARCVSVFGEVVDTFPYRATFEMADDNWWTDGKNDDWERGTPNNNLINTAADGTQAWVTDLDDDYSNAGLSLLHTPCFDLSGMAAPTLAFALHSDIEDNEETPSNLYDFVRIQYSTNGKNWTVLGNNGSGHQWYNNAGGAKVWDGTLDGWQIARHPIPVTASTIRFRWQFNSDRFTRQEGVGIDEFYVYDAADSDHFVQLTAKVSLEGVFEATEMRDDLRELNQLPLTQPYAEHSGTESITNNSLLQVMGSDAIVDWVLIDLYLNGSKVATQAALVQRDGDILNTEGSSILHFFGLEANDYQIGVRHRNHLGVMSALEVKLGYFLLE
ncbi:MAG: S8 family serine peptidase [Bacteroidota bacterium]